MIRRPLLDFDALDGPTALPPDAEDTAQLTLLAPLRPAIPPGPAEAPPTFEEAPDPTLEPEAAPSAQAPAPPLLIPPPLRAPWAEPPQEITLLTQTEPAPPPAPAPQWPYVAVGLLCGALLAVGIWLGARSAAEAPTTPAPEAAVAPAPEAAVAPAPAEAAPPPEVNVAPAEAAPEAAEPPRWSVRFAYGGARPLTDDPIPAALLQCARITVEGYGCSRGTTASNLRISQMRADYLRDRLIQAGYPASQIASTGVGLPPDPTHGHEQSVDPSDPLAAERRADATCTPER